MRAKGIDISHWQGSFTDPGNLDFIIIKASEGVAYDPKHDEFYQNACSIPVKGAYHYFRTSVDPIMQGDTFLDAVSDKDYHFLAVDYETRNNTLDRQGAENLLKMLKYLRVKQPAPVLIYTGPYCYRDNLEVWSKEFILFPLWIARWRYSDAEVADPTTGLSGGDLGRDWSIWQWTNLGEGSQAGVDSETVDRDVYNGTLQEMIDWLGIEEEVMEPKKWYQSKTLWFSILFALVNLAAVFGYADFVPGDDVVQYVNIGVSVLVAILRAFTDRAVSL